MIRVELVGDPQGKGRPRFRHVQTRDGRTFTTAYTPAKTRRYEDALRLAARAQMAGFPPLHGPVHVTVMAFLPIPESWTRRRREQARAGDVRPTGRPDWENLAKCLDAFNGVVWHDDSQVVSGYIAKWYSDRPRLVVQVSEAHVDAQAMEAA